MSKRPAMSQEQPTAKRIHKGNEILDALVSVYLQGGLPSDDTLARVLSTIVMHAPPEARLREIPTLAESTDLIKANTDVKNAVRAAIDRQSYEDVMSLPVLQNIKPLGHDFDSCMEATFNAINAPYVGGFPEALLQTVDGCYGDDGHNNAISIIQSSGAGKSRGVIEAAKIRFSFLFNVRCPVEGTYPPSDKNVRGYLKDQRIDKIERKITAFLSALFTCAQELLSTSDREGVPLAEWWFRHLNGNVTPYRLDPKRSIFYDWVIEKAEKLYSGDSQDMAGALKHSCGEFVKYLQSQYEQDNRSVNPPRVACLLTFDEAQDLAADWGPRGRTKEEWSPLYYLVSVLKIIKPLEIFTVFLSTNLNTDFQAVAPPVSLRSSTRQPRLHPITTELPFDVFARDLYDELREHGKSNLSATCTVDVMARFGRPMWYALHKHGYSRIMWLASGKLNPGHDFEWDNHAKLACLAIRLGLEFDIERAIARTTDIKLVEEYMRVVFAVPSHRLYVLTGTLSEPIVADAAAWLLNGQTSSVLNLAPRALQKAFDDCLLTREESPKVVARLLWTLAHDLLLKDSRDIFGCDGKFHKPIHLLDFLRALFHEDYLEAILDARPVGDDTGVPLSEAFKDAYVHFSHFMNGTHCDVDFLHVYKLLLRGASLICPRDPHRTVDFLTPIFFGDPDENQISKANTSVMVAQARNEHSVADVGEIGVGIPVHAEFPVLTLVHHLGARESGVECSPPVASDGGEGVHAASAGARSTHYQIVARGCTHETYAVIPVEEDSTYRQMLADSDEPALAHGFALMFGKTNAELCRRMEPATGLGHGQKCEWFGEDVE